MNSNEKFVHQNTRTSHKRLESMVVYALHYALRDVEILSQHSVVSKGKTYLIDAYLPSIKLAVEIDEPHHELQIENDKEREKTIREHLGCEFKRINCHSSIYEQVDELVNYIKAQIKRSGIPPWRHEPRTFNLRSGEYSQANIEALEKNNIPDLMAVVAEELRSEGSEIYDGRINGIPSQANGELGFLLKKDGITFAIYARSTGTIRVRVMDYEDDEALKEVCEDLLHARQEHSRYPKGAMYFALPDNKNSYPNWEEAKVAFYEFLSFVSKSAGSPRN